MTEFIQLHILASYPPSNLNRDDLGRPKTAIMGNTQRLRISSQSLKRAWRQSELFQKALSGHIGIRTKEMGNKIVESLVSGKTLWDILKEPNKSPVRKPVPEKKAIEWAKLITNQFGKVTGSDTDVKTEQIVHYSPRLTSPCSGGCLPIHPRIIWRLRSRFPMLLQCMMSL